MRQILNELLKWLPLPSQSVYLNAEEPNILVHLARLENKIPEHMQMIVRLHTEMPYFGRVAEGDGYSRTIMEILRNNPNVTLASNSQRMADDCTVVLGKQCHFLPTYYDMPALRERPKDDGIDRVICPGRLVAFKNITTQAVAAMRYSLWFNRKLEFWVNSLPDHDGMSVLTSLKALFHHHPTAVLKVFGWPLREEFLDICAKMSIGLQCSLSECDNTVVKDFVSIGLPMVVSNVKWACECVDPTDSIAISKAMLVARSSRLPNRRLLQMANDKVMEAWLPFVGKKVLSLRQDNNLTTGVACAVEGEIAYLRGYGVDYHACAINFTPENILCTISQHQPDIVISESSFIPVNTCYEEL